MPINRAFQRLKKPMKDGFTLPLLIQYKLIHKIWRRISSPPCKALVYYLICQDLSSFFIKAVRGSNNKYVKIRGTNDTIKGNIKFINNSFKLKYPSIIHAPS